ncbi:hypothetical protein TWF506_007194 [Arthrobotrys conoides]|uniref:Uncharacterized protein n=1 Tax=Arthrobotrys conoides TaxID=74498 RepID=A0AAN8NPB2_9PEZI
MSSSADWSRWPNRLDSSDIHEGRSTSAEKYKHQQRQQKICWLDIFVELYEYITHIFKARFRFPAVIFLVGIGLGYFISLSRVALVSNQVSSTDFDISPKSAMQAPLPLPRATWSQDPYLLPPLSGERLPVVPSHNILGKDSKTLIAAKKLIPQTPMTPLFIPFGRNHFMLQQTVLSYIAAGWPRSQIYIIDNTGTMDANLRGLLSDTNPFHLDYKLYRSRYGVNIIRTPTLYSFAQLQNFMLSTAMNKGWSHYYWTHQDVVALSDETRHPYKSFYENVVSSLVSLYPSMNSATAKKDGKRWGLVWYSFDHLSLVNVAVAFDTKANIGAWDIFIPYYHSDCDYYERMRLNGFEILERRVGDIYDVAKHLEDPERIFFGGEKVATAMKGTEKESIRNEKNKLGSRRYKMLKRELKALMKAKNAAGKDRNTWQDELKGGKGEPWTYDAYGFETAWWTITSVGRSIFQKKWGTLECQPSNSGKGLKRIWNAGDGFRYGRQYGDDDDDDDDDYYYGDDSYDDDYNNHGGLGGTGQNFVSAHHDDGLDHPDEIKTLENHQLNEIKWNSDEDLRAWDDSGLGMEPKSHEGLNSRPFEFTDSKGHLDPDKELNFDKEDDQDHKPTARSKSQGKFKSDTDHPDSQAGGVDTPSTASPNKPVLKNSRPPVQPKKKAVISRTPKTEVAAKPTAKAVLPEEKSRFAKAGDDIDL